jgi:hypothetical protein
MHDSSDGIAEEVERHLQLALAAAAIAARRAAGARAQAIALAQRDTEHRTRAVRAGIEIERLAAAGRLRVVLDPEWWDTARPQQIADMWREANTWCDPGLSSAAAPTIFDRAAKRIAQEVHDRSGLDVTQVLALATVQELEHEDQATLAQAADEPPEMVSGVDGAQSSFDNPRRRAQLRARLVGAGVPETAIEARTLADLAQVREAAEATQAPSVAASEPRSPGRRAGRELQRVR